MRNIQTWFVATIIATALVATITYYFLDKSNFSFTARNVANKANETEIRENIQAKSQIINETIESVTQESQPIGDQAAQSVELNHNSVSIESDFPPDVDAVVYSEIEHQNGLLTIPRIPDPKSQFMRTFALSYPNGTDFQHDSYSTNYSSCPITSQIILNVTNWTFQTLDEDGKFKTRGGDEWFIFYEDQDLQRTSCVAHIIDHEDGQYSLKFTASPYLNTSIPLNEKGKLIIWLEYSCGVGAILRPFKDTWRTNGAILTKWIAEDIPRPSMQDFINPNVNKTIDLGKFRAIMSAGDSLMQHFVSKYFGHFHWSNLAFDYTLKDPLLNRSYTVQYDMLEKRLSDFVSKHKRVALLLGFAAWELQKPYGNGEPIPGEPYADVALFADHLEALSNLVHKVRSNFPNVTILWKTGEYMHLHVVARDKGSEWLKIERLEYMCRHRTMMLYTKQIELMDRLEIPVIDIMDSTYLMPDRHRDSGDALHYDRESNILLISWFYPNGLNISALDNELEEPSLLSQKPMGKLLDFDMFNFSTDLPPPMPDIVQYNGSTLLRIPVRPDPKSRYMQILALSYNNGTDFSFDDVSRSYAECPVTSQITLNTQEWTFTTHGPDGMVKSRGDDEFFIYYEDSDISGVTSVAEIIDHHNASYSLKFTNSPFLNTSIPLNDNGRLVIWLEYSCDVSMILRPYRNSWATNGAILTSWTVENIPQPPMQDFIQPNADGAIDFSKYRIVVGAGDSVMQHFVAKYYNHFYWENLAFGKNLADPLLGRSYQSQLDLLKNRFDFLLSKHKNLALVLGYAAWELQRPFGKGSFEPGQPYSDQDIFKDHLEAIEKLIVGIQSSYPSIHIFWKSGQYIHLHVTARDKGDEWMKIDRLDYMCRHRTMMLYEMQNALMKKLNVTVIDLMGTTFLLPDHHKSPGDALHYDIPANLMMVSWYYPNGLNFSALATEDENLMQGI